jgi:hypothetical protein
MIWLLIVIAVVLAIALIAGCRDVPPDAATYRAAVGLRAIRKRQEVTQFKSEVRRDGARARHELRAGLDELSKRGRS